MGVMLTESASGATSGHPALLRNDQDTHVAKESPNQHFSWGLQNDGHFRAGYDANLGKC